ncbi:MAG: hypothetical protein HOV86_06505 [Thermoactinospora sp.]|nr:hypothetical protein [Thermoactinospora sp.]
MRAITLMAIAALATAPVTAAEAVTARGADPDWRKLTSFRVSPGAPHQNDVIRVLLHCPDEANHAIVGSTAFPLKGSWRIFREVGLGLGERGFAKAGVIISRYAPPGDHVVRMKCVNVVADEKTGLRKVKVISRSAVPLVVRPFRVRQFF